MTKPCKSPAHRRYSQAIEGLYIQAHLAEQDLFKALAEARTENPTEPQMALLFKQHRVDEAAERLAFGKSEYEEAERVVRAHLTRGCRNVT